MATWVQARAVAESNQACVGKAPNRRLWESEGLVAAGVLLVAGRRAGGGAGSSGQAGGDIR